MADLIKVGSHCCYCSMQCKVDLHLSEGGKVDRLQGAKEFPPTGGKLCQKGLTAKEHVHHPDRLLTPLIRMRGELVPTDWDEALNVVTERLNRVKAECGSDAIGVYGGGSLTNEKAYWLGKFARLAIGTKNIDYNGRYCMSSAAAAMNRAFGIDRGMTIPLADISHTRCIVLVGTNIAECQPTMMPFLRDAQKNGGYVVVIDPRETTTARFANEHIAIRPGTDAAFFNALLRVMVDEGLVDRQYIEDRTVGFEQASEAVADCSPMWAESVCGVEADRIVRLARRFSRAQSGLILTARGIEQQATGVASVQACINVALATGNVGKHFGGFGAVTGQGNGQGGREHGQKADQLPGYRSIEDPVARAHVASVWGVDPELIPRKGLSAFEMIQAMARKEVRALLVIASNPVASSPNRSLVVPAFASLSSLIVIDMFLSETAQMADVVLPGSAWTEDEGTMTTLEGRVVLRKAAEHPPGEARLDWVILQQIAQRLGAGRMFASESVEEIFKELGRASAGGAADYAGMSYERIEREHGLFWPCPTPEHPGTPRMFQERFAHSDGKARFIPVPDEVHAQTDTGNYPYILTTGRVTGHYLTGTQTRRTSVLQTKCPEPYAEIHSKTARSHQLEDGEMVHLETSYGRWEVRVKVTDIIREDTVFVPFHWEGSQSVNVLTGDRLDPISRMPAFKRTPVRLIPLASGTMYEANTEEVVMR